MNFIIGSSVGKEEELSVVSDLLTRIQALQPVLKETSKPGLKRDENSQVLEATYMFISK